MPDDRGTHRVRAMPPDADVAEVRGVFGRVRRDRQVSNLLYGLLGWEDERDPQRAIAELATSARKTLEGAGPDYLERVGGAAHLLIEMVLDVAREQAAAARVSARLTLAERAEAVRVLGAPHGPVRELPAPECVELDHDRRGDCDGPVGSYLVSSRGFVPNGVPGQAAQVSDVVTLCRSHADQYGEHVSRTGPADA